MQKRDAAQRLALGQGLWFALTGVWPLLHLRSFEAVTGPKPEGWLVKTVGALLVVGGGALALASRRRLAPEWAVLGAGSALALAGIDVWYAGVRRRISPVYLADAVVELGLVAAWAAARPRLTPDAPSSRWRGAERLPTDAATTPSPV